MGKRKLRLSLGRSQFKELVNSLIAKSEDPSDLRNWLEVLQDHITVSRDDFEELARIEMLKRIVERHSAAEDYEKKLRSQIAEITEELQKAKEQLEKSDKEKDEAPVG